MSINADQRVVELIHRAQAAQRGGDVVTARRTYEQALTIDERHPAVLNGLGLIALRGGDAAAATWFDRATRADPTAGPLWLNLAAAHRAHGRDDAERVALERALSVDQRNVMANYRLADLLERTGDPRGAVQRWHGIATMLGQADDLGPELQRVRALAQERVVAHGTALGQSIDEALANARRDVDRAQRHRFDRCVDAMLGRRRIYLNEPQGLHYPFLPADEFFDRDHFPWFAALEAETAAIRAEFEALYAAPDAGFTPYVRLDDGTPDNRWSALDRSSDWSARYLWRFGVRDDVVCARCPRTAAALEAVPRVALAGQAPTAFFSVLAPGARLPAHTGVSNVRAIVHLPLVVPPGCGFRVGGEVREWRVGEAFAFDDTIEHEAWNEGSSPRAVLILDVWNPHLGNAERTMLSRLYEVLELSGSGMGAAAD